MVWVSKAGYFDPNLEKFLIESMGMSDLLINGYWVPGFGYWGIEKGGRLAIGFGLIPFYGLDSFFLDFSPFVTQSPCHFLQAFLLAF